MKKSLLILFVSLNAILFGQNIHYTKPNCDDIDGLEFEGVISVEDRYTGFAYRCNAGKVEFLKKYDKGKLIMNQLWFKSSYDTEICTLREHFIGDKVIWKSYDKIGTLRIEENYLNQKDDKGLFIRDGLIRHLLKDEIIIEENYSNGKLHGVKRMFKNDNLLYEENFVDGLYHGKSTYYEKNNFQLSSVHSWKKNKRHGLMLNYHEGKLYAKVLWKKGQIRKYKCWDTNGQPVDCNFTPSTLRLREACVDDNGNAVWCDVLNPNY